MDYTSILNPLYNQYFGREADQGGLDYWSGMLSNGQVSPQQLASIFAASPEAVQYANSQSAGAANPTGLTGSQTQGTDYTGLLNTAYQNEFGRAPDAEGLNYWSNMLSTGQISPDDLSRLFSGSEEGMKYDAQNAGTTTGGTVAGSTTGSQTGTPATNEELQKVLNDVYMSEVGRAPDAAGMDYWLSQLQNGAITPEGLKAAFSKTPEGSIYDTYANELYRSADPAGMQYWLGQFNKGMSLADIQKAIGGSPEAIVQDAYHSVLGRTGEKAGVDYWLDQYAKGNMTYAQLQAAIRAAGIEKKEPTVIGNDGKPVTPSPTPNNPPTPENPVNPPTPVTARVFTPAEMEEYYTYGQRPEHRFYAPGS